MPALELLVFSIKGRVGNFEAAIYPFHIFRFLKSGIRHSKLL